MAKSVLKRAKHLLKRSLATSVALVVAMVAVSLSLATKISYAEEQTLTKDGVTVKGNFSVTTSIDHITEFPTGSESENMTYESLKTYVNDGYDILKTLELAFTGSEVDTTGDLTITFTLGNEYNGREGRVWQRDKNGMPASADGTVTAKFRSLSPFMVAIAPASAETPAPTGTNGTNGSSKSSNGNKKTGDSALALGISSIGLLTLFAAGLLLFKKKREAYHFN